MEHAPESFDSEAGSCSRHVHPEGVPKYLTAIISSSLAWIDNDADRDSIWETASQRLSERSGRNARGGFSRRFIVPTGSDGDLDFEIHEPTLTGDNLGFKTWGSSYVLAKSLPDIYQSYYVKALEREPKPAIIELGAGTGLTGLAAAAIFRASVLLTDLPEIVPNLQHNIDQNRDLLLEYGADAASAVLDWSRPSDHVSENLKDQGEENGFEVQARYDVILVADPIYADEHPAWLVQSIVIWLSKRADSFIAIAYPIREAYSKQIQELHHLLKQGGLELFENGTESSRDDWTEEVLHFWGVWKWVP